MQTVALAAIVPFVQLLVEPEKTQHAVWVEWLSAILGPQNTNSLLLMVGLGLLILVGLKNILAWQQLRWQSEFSARCENRLGSQLFNQTLNVPYSWLLTQNSAIIREIILGHVISWSRGFIRTTMQLANDLFFAIFVVVFLVWSSPKAGLLVLGIAIFFGWSLFKFTRPIILAKTKEKRDAIQRASLICIEGVSGIKDVKMTGSQAFFIRDFDDSFSRYSHADAQANLWKNLPRFGLEFIGYGALIMVTVVSSSLGEASGSTATLMALYAVATIRMLPVLSNLVTSLGGLLDVSPLIEDINKMLRETTIRESSDHVHTIKTDFKGWERVKINELFYKYPRGDNYALKNVSIEIECGRSYGLVGPSGAGKSTFADILAGLLQPESASISVDNIPLCKGNIIPWRNRVGYVSQHPFILDRTLQENITFGIDASEVDKDRLYQAIRGAQLESTIDLLPDGLNTRLGERGVRLSGGQRQRVAIARALYRNVNLLILDEATSALDCLTERDIAQEINALAGQVTVVLIAHRMETVRNCDRIFVFANGELSDSGSHDDLILSSGLYKSLIGAHAKGQFK
jgi:ABC-type bacteriocin/lantibiotic exporter with double-glycine peptidase domain